MVSPYARRIRLAHELRVLREAAGLTHDQLARKIGENRSKISRLENSRITPDPDDVIRILDALDVGEDVWEQVRQVARNAAARDWWHGKKEIGVRQAMYADLETGAVKVREYHPGALPGLFQTSAYCEDLMPQESEFQGGTTREGVLEGRSRRQQVFHRSGGPALNVILDEVLLWRENATPAAMVETLRRVLDAAAYDPKVEVRVLSIQAKIPGYRMPLGTFFLYSYPDPGDPVISAHETVTRDIVFDSLHHPEEVSAYVNRYDLLWGASLSEEASIKMITDAVGRLSQS